ncbi:MAG: PhnD/SsuA/transferrin family substrate-binding protein [Spirochaetales bacterium]|nr:PhnD/SsuA/transferrin family substrate-binding protein [Spirochaetales bacterium]
MKNISILLLAGMFSAAVFAAGSGEEAGAGGKGPLIWVWYPNESTPEFAESRQAVIEVASKALGREIKEQLTTDYAIAIEALVNENAALSWFGGEGYVQAHAKEKAVLPLAVNTGNSGTLSDAKYYSMIGTLVENGPAYMSGGKYDLAKLKQKKFSFVSNSSTSGFRVPSSVISKQFNVPSEELLEGGPDMVFSEVMFGGSHQGSFFNVLTKKADIGAFCNTCIKEYIDWEKGVLDDPLPGDIIVVKKNADAPFDQVPGIRVVLVATVPVLNAPIVMNTNILSPSEVQALKDAFTSDETAANEKIFAPKGSTVKTFFHAGQRFALVDDAWYDPIRALSGMK